MSIEIRKYKLLDTRFKNALDFTEFKARIKECFKIIVGNRVRVIVRPRYYIVIGDITNRELRKVGKLINKHPAIGKFCRKTSTGTRLVQRAEYIKLSKKEYESVYHFYEGMMTNEE